MMLLLMLLWLMLLWDAGRIWGSTKAVTTRKCAPSPKCTWSHAALPSKSGWRRCANVRWLTLSADRIPSTWITWPPSAWGVTGVSISTSSCAAPRNRPSLLAADPSSVMALRWVAPVSCEGQPLDGSWAPSIGHFLHFWDGIHAHDPCSRWMRPVSVSFSFIVPMRFRWGSDEVQMRFRWGSDDVHFTC